MQADSLTLRFKVGRVPVVVEPWFWLGALLMGAHLRGPAIALWVFVVFASVLVHELGHALAARAFGANAWVSLHGLGGLTRPDRQLRRWQDLAMTLAGPMAGFALAAVAYLVRHHAPLVSHLPNARMLLRMLVDVNLAWGVFNLLPVPPLDGGHAALALAGSKRARQVRWLAVAVSALVVMWSVTAGQPYAGLLVGLMGYRNWQALQER